MQPPSKTNATKPRTKLKKNASSGMTSNRKAVSSAPSSSSAVVPANRKPVDAGATTQQQQQQDGVDEEIHLDGSGADTAHVEATSSSSPTGASYGGYGGMGYGGGMMGMGMMPGMGMYGMGMGMGMYGGGMMGSQWLFSLNQFLFGIQSVVFSLGQAVQIVGMNAQQIRHVYDSMKGMVENAVGQVNEWCKISSLEDIGGVLGSKKLGIDARRWISGGEDEGQIRERGSLKTEEGENLTQSETIRRRRLAAFRWTLTMSISYILYKAIRRLVRALIFGNRSMPNRGGQLQDSMMSSPYQMQQARGYGDYGGMMGNQPYGNGMRYGGGNYGSYGQHGYSRVGRGYY
mmetsp:Transcript_20532/g.39568  ORF Transcript_20532/g.39568 Transcript_20532/m.39568 type:complete len:345 (+) Transcript_20532:1451-2485(+)